MALGLIQPITEMSIRNIPLGGGGEVKVRPALKADKFIVMSELIVYKM
jgi:hypothetical protein